MIVKKPSFYYRILQELLWCAVPVPVTPVTVLCCAVGSYNHSQVCLIQNKPKLGRGQSVLMDEISEFGRITLSSIFSSSPLPVGH